LLLDPPDTIVEPRALLLKQEHRDNSVQSQAAIGHMTPQEWLLISAEGR
jgi:hypothetical protein